jgi:hypothetical protein
VLAEHSRQTPPTQWPLVQSVPATHALPFAQAGHCGPPQSTSVSPPFLCPSEHVAAGCEQTPPVQTPLSQSLPVVQPLPSAHFGHVGPPQSMSVSVPFFVPSVHVGAVCCGCSWVPPTHLPAWQV